MKTIGFIYFFSLQLLSSFRAERTQIALFSVVEQQQPHTHIESNSRNDLKNQSAIDKRSTAAALYRIRSGSSAKSTNCVVYTRATEHNAAKAGDSKLEQQRATANRTSAGKQQRITRSRIQSANRRGETTTFALEWRVQRYGGAFRPYAIKSKLSLHHKLHEKTCSTRLIRLFLQEQASTSELGRRLEEMASLNAANNALREAIEEQRRQQTLHNEESQLF